jgi:hypothetical protein
MLAQFVVESSYEVASVRVSAATRIIHAHLIPASLFTRSLPDQDEHQLKTSNRLLPCRRYTPWTLKPSQHDTHDEAKNYA